MRAQVFVSGVGWLETQVPAPPKDAEGRPGEIVQTTMLRYMRQLTSGELINCKDDVGLVVVKADSIQAVRIYRDPRPP